MSNILLNKKKTVFHRGEIKEEYRMKENGLENKGRTARISRKTTETDITLAINLDGSGKASVWERLKKMSMIIFPLIFSSMDRIDVVSNAMELRGFGKHKKRTWYKGRKLTKTDYMTLAFAAVFMIASLWITFADGNRFYNPFSR